MAIASSVTTGTKIAEMRSARRWIGAFALCASTTMAVIRASSVSLPIRVARTIMRPLLFIDAPITEDPGATSTGIDSPVSIELSTEELPEITTPSVGIRAPGLTTNSSPITRCSIGINTSRPLRRTVTSFALKERSEVSALLARCFARDSKKRPKITKRRTPAATSV